MPCHQCTRIALRTAQSAATLHRSGDYGALPLFRATTSAKIAMTAVARMPNLLGNGLDVVYAAYPRAASIKSFSRTTVSPQWSHRKACTSGSSPLAGNAWISLMPALQRGHEQVAVW